MTLDRSFSFSKGLSKYLKNKIEDESLLKTFRTESRYFTWDSGLSFSLLIYFLLPFVKSSCHQELDIFFEESEMSYTMRNLERQIKFCCQQRKLKPN